LSPAVSVILPVHNGGEYLAAAVSSILGQSFHNLELLLVDDRSDDGAIAGLDTWDERLCILNSKQSGVAGAFNYGLARARGSFIARMDADDLSLPERLAQQLDYLESHPGVDICGGGVEIFSDQVLGAGNLRYQDWLNNCRSPEKIRRELFIESPIPNPTAMFRRDAIDRLGGYRNPDWPEDYDLFLRADAAGMRMGKPDGVVLKWREHGQRLTRTDPRYDIARFQAAKAHFLVSQRLRGRSIVIWGAGPTGTLMHDLLKSEGAVIQGFLEVHPRRIGGSKRGLPVWAIDHVSELNDEIVLVAVGAAGAREEIGAYMLERGKKEGPDYLFVA
jgi:glycosyltransferase involved in cell wall biosynthesis